VLDLLGALLVPDSWASSTTQQTEGIWLLTFGRRLDGVPLYSDRPVRVWLNDAGQVTAVQGRRRPLLTSSRYSLRLPHAAWTLLQQGCGFAPNLPADPVVPATMEEFVVETVELAYLETHVNRPQELWQPYNVFRNDHDQMLVIPAVDDPHIEWPR